MVNGGRLSAHRGDADMPVLWTVVLYIDGGVSPVEEGELEVVVDAVRVPSDPIIWCDRFPMLGAFLAWDERA